MSLTNPKNVVTEERLNEYHQAILPYLGGMPDVLANKFNKSDLYSTDETIIGRWIDGKPLYQKTITGTTPTLSNSWTTVATISSNIEECIESNIVVYLSKGFYFVNTFTEMSAKVTENGELALSCIISDLNNKPYKATFQYTKTTDSAVAIGSDTDYSTTEKIVGTWIDGKALWKKTFILQSSVTLTPDNWITVYTDATIGDITRVVFCEVAGGNNISYGDIHCKASNNNLQLQLFNAQLNLAADTAVTIKYTKKS